MAHKIKITISTLILALALVFQAVSVQAATPAQCAAINRTVSLYLSQARSLEFRLSSTSYGVTYQILWWQTKRAWDRYYSAVQVKIALRCR